MTLRSGYGIISKTFLSVNRNIYKLNINFLQQASSYVDESKTEPVVALEEIDDDSVMLENEIEVKRNKSGLSEKHLRILKGLPPIPGSDDFHKSLKYKRKIYGLYGKASGIDPGTLWPNGSDLDEVKGYESVAYPYTFHEMVTKVKEKRAEEHSMNQARQKKLADNLKKVTLWMKEVETKKEKKMKEIMVSKEKKDKMLEDVRKQLGYNVDIKDEKFKLALLQKEKDMKKQLKEEKAKAKQERLLRALNSEAS